MLTSYLEKLRPELFNRTVYHLGQAIKEKAPNCNIVYGRGTSSALVLAAVAAHLGVGWAFIRKEGTNNCHASYSIEVALAGDTCKSLSAVFIDDLVDTGESYKKCKESLAAFCKEREMSLECLGAALYHYLDGEFVLDADLPNPEI
jgi:adenine/guanine phosphoribosyltransferase-like PRPP-binding protein